MRTLRAICFRRWSTCFSMSAVGTDIDTRRSRFPSVSTLDGISSLFVWCEGRDSNPHALRRQILSLVRLPIPPPSQKNQRIIAADGGRPLRELPRRFAAAARILAPVSYTHLRAHETGRN